MLLIFRLSFQSFFIWRCSVFRITNAVAASPFPDTQTTHQNFWLNLLQNNIKVIWKIFLLEQYFTFGIFLVMRVSIYYTKLFIKSSNIFCNYIYLCFIYSKARETKYFVQLIFSRFTLHGTITQVQIRHSWKPSIYVPFRRHFVVKIAVIFRMLLPYPWRQCPVLRECS